MHTDLTLLLDRSGSMWSIKPDTDQGLEEFLVEQKKVPGTATLTAYQFDTVVEKTVDCKDILDVSCIPLEPRGETAMFDAIGRVIVETDSRLSDLAVPPDKVLFMVITDGGENSSKEYTRQMVVDLVEKFRRRWQFVYIGADDNTMQDAAAIGIEQAATMTFIANRAGVKKATKVISDAVTRFRTQGMSSGFFLPGEGDG